MVDRTAPSGFKGFCIDLMDLIVKRDNLKYKIEIVEDGEYGNVNDKVKLVNFKKKIYLISASS
jgi:hypothetical protein